MHLHSVVKFALALVLPSLFAGCAVIAVTAAVGSAAVAVGSAAVSVGTTAAGVAVDAVVGTAKVVGGAVTPGDDKPASK